MGDWFYRLNWIKATDSVGFKLQIRSPIARNSSMSWVMIMAIMLDQLNWMKAQQIFVGFKIVNTFIKCQEFKHVVVVITDSVGFKIVNMFACIRN